MIQKSKDVLYSDGNNDECYTPDYGVKPIIKYLVHQQDCADGIISAVDLHKAYKWQEVGKP